MERLPLPQLSILWYNAGMGIRMRRGQAALEYVLALCSVAVVAGILWWVISAAEHHKARAESLVTTDCP